MTVKKLWWWRKRGRNKRRLGGQNVETKKRRRVIKEIKKEDKSDQDGRDHCLVISGWRIHYEHRYSTGCCTGWLSTLQQQQQQQHSTILIPWHTSCPEMWSTSRSRQVGRISCRKMNRKIRTKISGFSCIVTTHQLDTMDLKVHNSTRPLDETSLAKGTVTILKPRYSQPSGSTDA